MRTEAWNKRFGKEVLEKLFPRNRSDRFFDAIFGDPGEGAYDIELVFQGCRQNRLHFDFHLKRRPGKCLACHLTSGLPEVFRRHPVINIKDLIQKIQSRLDDRFACAGWRLGLTRQVSEELHVIPLTIDLTPD
jgi:hypothetical protein